MFKKIGITFLMASLTLPVMAKSILTQDIVERLDRDGDIDKLRVYVNKKLNVDFESKLEDETNTNRDVTRVVKKKVLRETVTKKTRGMILQIEDYNPCGLRSLCSAPQVLRLYVTFDPECKDTRCAFQFERKLDVGRNNVTNGQRYSYNDKKAGQRFYLSNLPEREGYHKAEAKRDVFLRFNYKEVFKVDRDRRRHGGID
jgi:hypothetical protein